MSEMNCNFLNLKVLMEHLDVCIAVLIIPFLSCSGTIDSNRCRIIHNTDAIVNRVRTELQRRSDELYLNELKPKMVSYCYAVDFFDGTTNEDYSVIAYLGEIDSSSRNQTTNQVDISKIIVWVDARGRIEDNGIILVKDGEDKILAPSTKASDNKGLSEQVEDLFVVDRTELMKETQRMIEMQDTIPFDMLVLYSLTCHIYLEAEDLEAQWLCIAQFWIKDTMTVSRRGYLFEKIFESVYVAFSSMCQSQDVRIVRKTGGVGRLFSERQKAAFLKSMMVQGVIIQEDSAGQESLTNDAESGADGKVGEDDVEDSDLK